MSDSESQEFEILALQNIYEERDFAIEALNPPSGRFVADIRLPAGFIVQIEPISEQNGAHRSDNSEFIEVQYLPPITLFFEFPSNYPTHSPPAFLLSCNWLTMEQISKLAKHLESLWEFAQDAILYTWFQFLQEEALDFLHINNCLDITPLLHFRITDNFKAREALASKDAESSDFESSSAKSFCHHIRPTTSGGSGAVDYRAFNDLTLGKNLPQILRDFNLKKKQDVFKTTSHTCDICFMTQEGTQFLTFRACDHAYCRSCLKSYFEVQIQDGNVKSLSCPTEKCEAQADASMIKHIVSKELFDKYDALLLSRTLEEMTDIVYCPRPFCRSPVLLETCGRLGSCPTCNFVFCAFCMMGYHGVAPCRFKMAERKEIFQKYTEGTSDVKEFLVKKYGKKTINHIVENVQSEEWIQSFSKNCPSCRTPIEKTDGCNKMTCFKCGTYFCWLCVQKLNLANPYAHFRERSSECYMQLFPEDMVDNDAFFPGEFLNF